MKEEKKRLRAEVKDRVESMSETYMADASADMARRVINLPEYGAAKTIFVFYGVQGEPDTRAVIRDALLAGKTVAIPRTLPKGIMYAAVLTSLDQLQPGMYDIPTAPQDAPVIDKNDIDLMIVPAAAFDEQGFRLGRGGGYYDRYLDGFEGKTVGVIWDDLLLPRVPRQIHDACVDCIVTEKRVARLK